MFEIFVKIMSKLVHRKKTPHHSACDQITTGSHVNIYLHFITITRTISSSTSVQVSPPIRWNEKTKIALKIPNLEDYFCTSTNKIYATNFDSGDSSACFSISNQRRSFKNSIPHPLQKK